MGLFKDSPLTRQRLLFLLESQEFGADGYAQRKGSQNVADKICKTSKRVRLSIAAACVSKNEKRNKEKKL